MGTDNLYALVWCRRKTVSEKVRLAPQLCYAGCTAAYLLRSIPCVCSTDQQQFTDLQDFLDAVTKVIKGLSKFSATPAYMVRCVA